MLIQIKDSEEFENLIVDRFGRIVGLDNANDSQNKGLKYNYDLKIGEIDAAGERVTHVYAQQKNKYLVYSTEETPYPIVIAEDETPLRDDTEICTEILQYRDYKDNDKHLKNLFNSEYALAVSTILEGHKEVGRIALKTVREEIENFLQREATYYYLLGAAIVTTIVLVNHLIFYLFESSFEQRTQGVYYAVLFSTLGGFLSVALGASKINVELRNDEKRKAIYGALRMMIAILSGIVVYYAVIGGFAFSMVPHQGIPIYVVCVAAGFLEKLVPNIMYDVGSRNEAKESNLSQTNSETKGQINDQKVPKKQN